MEMIRTKDEELESHWGGSHAIVRNKVLVISWLEFLEAKTSTRTLSLVWGGGAFWSPHIVELRASLSARPENFGRIPDAVPSPGFFRLGASGTSGMFWDCKFIVGALVRDCIRRSFHLPLSVKSSSPAHLMLLVEYLGKKMTACIVRDRGRHVPTGRSCNSCFATKAMCLDASWGGCLDLGILQSRRRHATCAACVFVTPEWESRVARLTVNSDLGWFMV